MSVNLSIKNVPDDVADRLRARAARNRRSLQRELLTILEGAAAPQTVQRGPAPEAPSQHLSMEEVFERARQLFPKGTPSSVSTIRALRDQRAGIAPEPRARVPRRRRG